MTALSITARRQLIIEKIKRFERAWALACGLVESDPSVGAKATENLRGIRSVRRWLDLHESKDRFSVAFSLLSNQVRYGGIGAYSAMLESLRLANMHTGSLRPLGERLAEAFPSPRDFGLDVLRDDARLDRDSYWRRSNRGSRQ